MLEDAVMPEGRGPEGWGGEVPKKEADDDGRIKG